MLYALQFLALVNAGLIAWGALAPFMRRRKGRKGRSAKTGRAESGAFLTAARAIILALATFAAIVSGSREGFLWLAGIGAAFQLVESLIGQVERDPMRTLAPLGLGALQLVLLLIVVSAG
jgi:hypothetical protein